MTDLICRKSMMRCLTPGMCSPHGGCQPGKGFSPEYQDLGVFVDWVWNLKAERDQLKAENKALRKDAERLDRLEMECEAYGTDIHEGNRWVVDGPFATVRDAIDAAMAQEQQP